MAKTRKRQLIYRLTCWVLLILLIGIGIELTVFSYGIAAKFGIANLSMARSVSRVSEIQQVLGLRQFYSQLGQDKWIIGTVYPDVEVGYFVDVGCGDGVVDSNTKALEELGWTGVAIDPFPTNWENRKSQLFREVVSSREGELVQFRQAGLLGGIDETIDSWREEVDEAPLVELTTTTMGSILARAHSPSFIHYMSIDVEGAELDVLEGFPFSEYKVGAITIEHNFEEPKRQRIRQFLEEHGYRFVRQQTVDDWYVLAEDHL